MIKNTAFSAVGIIAEYNPFHNGHLYHMEQAKKLTGADYVVAVMSGDFVQRGAPAICDKYTRAAMALHSGADLVLEMPAVFATSSAEDFAACGIALLDRIGTVDSVCFGSECGQIADMCQIADILAREPESYAVSLKEHLRSGLTYPESRSLALLNYLNHSGQAAGISEGGSSIPSETAFEILNTPNNILGVEYCKALIRRSSDMKPFTVTRQGSGYHDHLGASSGFSSASGLRKAIEEQKSLEPLCTQVPDKVIELIRDKKFLFPNDFSAVLNAALLRLTESGESLCAYADVSEELESRIRKMALEYCSFEKRSLNLKTKQYTYTRISRALLHLMLGIRKSDVEAFRARDYAPYARVLGFRSSAGPLLSEIKRRAEIPLITKTADAKQVLSPEDLKLISLDFYCSHLYQSVLSSRYGTPAQNEYNRPLVII